jgi:hypothetical protein
MRPYGIGGAIGGIIIDEYDFPGAFPETLRETSDQLSDIFPFIESRHDNRQFRTQTHGSGRGKHIIHGVPAWTIVFGSIHRCYYNHLAALTHDLMM